MIDLAPADEPGRELLVAVDEAARRLSSPAPTLYLLIRRGELASVRLVLQLVVDASSAVGGRNSIS